MILTSKEKRNEYYRQYRAENSEKYKAITQRYWAKKAGEENVSTENECEASKRIAEATQEELQRAIKKVDNSGVLRPEGD